MPDYDWSRTEDIAVRSSAAIAVYLNPDGDLVIRQQRDRYEDEDSVVIVPRDRVAALVRKIASVADIEPLVPRIVRDRDGRP